MSEEMIDKVRGRAFYAIYALMVYWSIYKMYASICVLICEWGDVCVQGLSFKDFPLGIDEQIQLVTFLLLTPIMLFFSMKDVRERKKRAMGLLFVPFGFLILTMLIEVFYGWLTD